MRIGYNAYNLPKGEQSACYLSRHILNSPSALTHPTIHLIVYMNSIFWGLSAFWVRGRGRHCRWKISSGRVHVTTVIFKRHGAANSHPPARPFITTIVALSLPQAGSRATGNHPYPPETKWTMQLSPEVDGIFNVINFMATNSILYKQTFHW